MSESSYLGDLAFLPDNETEGVVAEVKTLIHRWFCSDGSNESPALMNSYAHLCIEAITKLLLRRISEQGPLPAQDSDAIFSFRAISDSLAYVIACPSLSDMFLSAGIMDPSALSVVLLSRAAVAFDNLRQQILLSSLLDNALRAHVNMRSLSGDFRSNDRSDLALLTVCLLLYVSALPPANDERHTSLPMTPSFIVTLTHVIVATHSSMHQGAGILNRVPLHALLLAVVFLDMAVPVSISPKGGVRRVAQSHYVTDTLDFFLANPKVRLSLGSLLLFGVGSIAPQSTLKKLALLSPKELISACSKTTDKLSLCVKACDAVTMDVRKLSSVTLMPQTEMKTVGYSLLRAAQTLRDTAASLKLNEAIVTILEARMKTRKILLDKAIRPPVVFEKHTRAGKRFRKRKARAASTRVYLSPGETQEQLE